MKNEGVDFTHNAWISRFRGRAERGLLGFSLKNTAGIHDALIPTATKPVDELSVKRGLTLCALLASIAVCPGQNLQYFSWTSILPHLKYTNLPFNVGVDARDGNYQRITNYTGQVTLRATNGAIAFSPTNAFFTNGVWNGTITVFEPVENLVFVVDDGNGHFGMSNPLDVERVPVSYVDHFVWDPISSPQYDNQLFTVTITAKDSTNGTIKAYVGQAFLRAATAGVTIMPTNTGAPINGHGSFSNGFWKANIKVQQVATNLVLIADDGSGDTGSSNPFDVQFTSINIHPTNLITFPGATVSLTASFAQSYQWRFNGTNIPGATNNPLVLTNIQMSQRGLYSVAVVIALSNTIVYRAVSSDTGLYIEPVVVWAKWPPTGQPTDLTNVLAVSAGYLCCLALKSDHTVVGWGDNTYGQASPPPGLSNVVSIVAGATASSALISDGTVVYWGSVTGRLAGLSNVVSISGNFALKSDGTVVAWGSNIAGQNNVPADLTNVVAISSGGGFKLALTDDGRVHAWGRASYGITNVPTDLTNVIALSAGSSHSLALRNDGKIFAWGDNYYGQTNVPTDLTSAIAIAATPDNSMATRSDGSLVVWGDVSYGVCSVPPGLTNVLQIGAGLRHGMALIGSTPLRTQTTATNAHFGSDGFKISVPTECGHVYRLEYKKSLLDSNWTPLPLVAGSGEVQTLTDSTASGGNSQRFYRVRRW